MENLAVRRDADDYAAGLGNAGFEIKKIDGRANGYRLVMKGFLSPGWIGRLTAGLAKRRIDIVSAQAEKVSTTAWHSTFELKAAPFAVDPLSHDYPTLAATEESLGRSAAKIELLNYTIEPCKGQDGSLYVEVQGVDRLGFLGDLLDYFSMRCLFPVKMTIETVGNAAVDRFWLRGVGGSRPSDSITSAVRENLEKLLIGKV
ncbi:hypothetical protein [Geomonas sp.]|uniref:hypothetical protein n=1 Tax=Geomonas sp. TaxID=2651584 RepID=UPI002B4A2B84|nr:hypothetical protein [Geomonas sp.]HJV36154.1 hypothetical protein [Geomonas sp.]